MVTTSQKVTQAEACLSSKLVKACASTDFTCELFSQYTLLPLRWQMYQCIMFSPFVKIVQSLITFGKILGLWERQTESGI